MVACTKLAELDAVTAPSQNSSMTCSSGERSGWPHSRCSHRGNAASSRRRADWPRPEARQDHGAATTIEPRNLPRFCRPTADRDDSGSDVSDWFPRQTRTAWLGERSVLGRWSVRLLLRLGRSADRVGEHIAFARQEALGIGDAVLDGRLARRVLRVAECAPSANTPQNLLRSTLRSFRRAPDVVTYEDMMRIHAEVAGLRRRLILPVPVLTPSLSSHWVGLVTSLPSDLAWPLLASLQNEVIVTDPAIDEVIPLETTGFRRALELALHRVADLAVPTRWSGATLPGRDPAEPLPTDPDRAGGTLFEDEQTVSSTASPHALYATVSSIGGSRGWLITELRSHGRGPSVVEGTYPRAT